MQTLAHSLSVFSNFEPQPALSVALSNFSLLSHALLCFVWGLPGRWSSLAAVQRFQGQRAIGIEVGRLEQARHHGLEPRELRALRGVGLLRGW